jgi:hypothetical protein
MILILETEGETMGSMLCPLLAALMPCAFALGRGAYGLGLNKALPPSPQQTVIYHCDMSI